VERRLYGIFSNDSTVIGDVFLRVPDTSETKVITQKTKATGKHCLPANVLWPLQASQRQSCRHAVHSTSTQPAGGRFKRNPMRQRGI